MRGEEAKEDGESRPTHARAVRWRLVLARVLDVARASAISDGRPVLRRR